MIIDIPLHIEQIIVNQAQAQGVSVEQLIIQKFAITQDYPKGDIRRLKNFVKTDISTDIETMNKDIVMGAIYGE